MARWQRRGLFHAAAWREAWGRWRGAPWAGGRALFVDWDNRRMNSETRKGSEKDRALLQKIDRVICTALDEVKNFVYMNLYRKKP
jgi:hypothetical protein